MNRQSAHARVYATIQNKTLEYMPTLQINSSMWVHRGNAMQEVVRDTTLDAENFVSGTLVRFFTNYVSPVYIKFLLNLVLGPVRSGKQQLWQNRTGRAQEQRGAAQVFPVFNYSKFTQQLKQVVVLRKFTELFHCMHVVIIAYSKVEDQ